MTKQELDAIRERVHENRLKLNPVQPGPVVVSDRELLLAEVDRLMGENQAYAEEITW